MNYFQLNDLNKGEMGSVGIIKKRPIQSEGSYLSRFGVDLYILLSWAAQQSVTGSAFILIYSSGQGLDWRGGG